MRFFSRCITFVLGRMRTCFSFKIFFFGDIYIHTWYVRTKGIPTDLNQIVKHR